MANTIKLAMRLQFWRGNVVVKNPPLKEVETETTSELNTDNVQIVGTTHEVIAAGDVTDSAACRIENLHATAIVSVGGDDTGAFVKWFDVPPGEVAFLPRVGALASTYLESDTVSTPVSVTLIKIVAPA
jgi:hypothetical protein